MLEDDDSDDDDEEEEEVVSDGEGNEPVVRKINSNVISANVPMVVIQNVDEPVELTFQHKQVGLFTLLKFNNG